MCSTAFPANSLTTDGGNCVEFAPLANGRIAMRDSKDPHGPALVFNPSEWKAFVSGVKGGEFDLA